MSGDWGNLPPGLEIDRLMAELLGESPRIMQDGEIDDLNSRGFSVTGWVKIYDGDELLGEQILPRSLDLNLAILLTVEGWQLKIEEWVEVGKSNSWLAQYYSNRLARGVGLWDAVPALAICKARLSLREMEGV